MKHLITYNESVRDLMTPKSKENIKRELNKKINVFMDVAKEKWTENERTLPINLGEMTFYQMKEKFGMTLVEHKFKKIANYSVMGAVAELKPYVKDTMTEWLYENFPKWTDSDISEFWKGFEEDLKISTDRTL